MEEATQDGSINTEYTKELSELLPLINFWLLPSVYPATAEELQHKYCFIMEALSKMGLPIWNDEMIAATEKMLADIAAKEGEQP